MTLYEIKDSFINTIPIIKTNMIDNDRDLSKYRKIFTIKKSNNIDTQLIKNVFKVYSYGSHTFEETSLSILLMLGDETYPNSVIQSNNTESFDIYYHKKSNDEYDIYLKMNKKWMSTDLILLEGELDNYTFWLNEKYSDIDIQLVKANKPSVLEKKFINLPSLNNNWNYLNDEKNYIYKIDNFVKIHLKISGGEKIINENLSKIFNIPQEIRPSNNITFFAHSKAANWNEYNLTRGRIYPNGDVQIFRESNNEELYIDVSYCI